MEGKTNSFYHAPFYFGIALFAASFAMGAHSTAGIIDSYLANKNVELRLGENPSCYTEESCIPCVDKRESKPGLEDLE